MIQLKVGPTEASINYLTNSCVPKSTIDTILLTTVVDAAVMHPKSSGKGAVQL